MDTRLNGLNGWDKEDLEDIIRNNIKCGYTNDFPEVAGEYLDYIIVAFEDEYLGHHDFQDSEEFKDTYEDLAQNYYDNKLIWDDDIRAIKETELSFEEQNDEFAKEKAFESFKDEMQDIALNTYSAFIQDDKAYNWRGFERSRCLLEDDEEENQMFAKYSLSNALKTAEMSYALTGIKRNLVYEFNSGDKITICKFKDIRNFNIEGIKNDLLFEDLKDDPAFPWVWNYFYKKNYEDVELARQDVVDAYRISNSRGFDGWEGIGEMIKERNRGLKRKVRTKEDDEEMEM